jgi:flavin-dependent dehydrogenase
LIIVNEVRAIAMPGPGADRVAVHGAGLAGLTCALLAARDGFTVTLVGTPSAPADLVLNEATIAVLTRVWDDPEERLLDGGHQLTGRSVRWGRDAAPVQVPASAVVVDGQRLVDALEQRLPTAVRRAEVAPAADWTVRAAVRPAGNPPVGRRVLLAGHAPMPSTAVSRMATTGRGWVGVVPVGNGRGLVQAMTPVPPEDPAGFLAEEIEAAGLGGFVTEPPPQVTVMPAAPWLSRQRAEPGRLHIGGAVLRLDPVSGSGAGHALRTAILAAAVIRGIRDGHPAADLLGHYHRRLGAAFHDHLTGCAVHYRAAFDSPEWTGELHITATALTGQAAQLDTRRGGPVFTGRRDVAAMT